MRLRKIQIIAFAIAILFIIAGVLEGLFPGLFNFIIGKDIIIFIVGLALVVWGVSDLVFLIDIYKMLKEKNSSSWLVLTELISELISTSDLKKALGEIALGLVLILVYVLLKLGIVHTM